MSMGFDSEWSTSLLQIAVGLVLKSRGLLLRNIEDSGLCNCIRLECGSPSKSSCSYYHAQRLNLYQEKAADMWRDRSSCIPLSCDPASCCSSLQMRVMLIAFEMPTIKQWRW